MSIAKKFEVIADAVYEKGKADEQLENWNNMIKDGIGAHCFSGSTWNDDTFNPKSDIVPTSCNWFFSQNNVTDLLGILSRNKVTLDTSQAENMSYSFYACPNLTQVPTIDYSKVTALGRMTYSLSGCPNLEFIDTIIFPDEYTTSTASTPNILYNLPKLNMISEIRGKIKFNLDISKSTTISDIAMQNICEHLYDFAQNDTGFANALTITFTADCWNLLEAHKAPEGFASWREYVESLGWKTA